MRQLRTSIRPVAVAATLLVLGACSVPVTKPAYYTSSYDPRGNLGYAQSHGGMPVEFRNLPFPEQEAETVAIVLKTLQANVVMPNVGFFDAREIPEDFRSPYYVVMGFGGSVSASQYHLCRRPPTARDDEAVVTTPRKVAKDVVDTVLGAVGAEYQGATPPSEPPPPAQPASDSIEAAFCVNRELLTSTAGWTWQPPTGPDDPDFVSLVAQVTRDIFPPVNPQRNIRAGPRISELTTTPQGE